ncbi:MULTISPECIES: Rieske (2Fe-2S) protein [unclassified Paraflavitalea]|uniref:Rieske (2Fe-2S) protein n=1 Tax=unclassified Paraflavitalea TaxID=2798305 RepID=UPI003D3565AF
MSDPNYKWFKVAASEEELIFPENGILELEVGGKTVCLGRFNGKLFAFAQKCPHAGGYFCKGWIDALGNVVCPLHRYKFNMETGRNVTGEGYYLKRWPVELREDGVWVAREKGFFF